jgi:glycosyltransferase involved in cell wall biosynthesis
MKNDPISLSIFFPTFNEEANIEQSVTKAITVAENSPFIGDYEVIVVNDGSSDATEEIVSAMAAANPRVRLVNHVVNRGAGAALATGFASATKDYVFYTDADLQFDILELNNLIIHTDTSPIVIGYRSPRNDPFMRLVNAKGWNILMRFFFGLKVRDVDCAFKIFRTDLVQSVTLQAEGAMTLAEILIRLQQKGAAFKEEPVTHWPRVAGSPTGAKLSVIAKAFREMLQLFYGDLGILEKKQMVKFMTVGVINTLVDFIAYFALTRGTYFFMDHITAARLLSILTGTVSSYVLNRAWTFEVKGKLNIMEILRFYSVTLSSLVLSLVVMWFLNDILGIYDLIAFGASTIFTFAVNFTFSRSWVFSKKVAVTHLETDDLPLMGVPADTH